MTTDRVREFAINLKEVVGEIREDMVLGLRIKSAEIHRQSTLNGDPLSQELRQLACINAPLEERRAYRDALRARQRALLNAKDLEILISEAYRDLDRERFISLLKSVYEDVVLIP